MHSNVISNLKSDLNMDGLSSTSTLITLMDAMVRGAVQAPAPAGTEGRGGWSSCAGPDDSETRTQRRTATPIKTKHNKELRY